MRRENGILFVISGLDPAIHEACWRAHVRRMVIWPSITMDHRIKPGGDKKTVAACEPEDAGVTKKKKYPGGRTFSQWRFLPYKERHAWVTQEKCDLLGYWAVCTKKKRCRRDRTCRGDQFDCYWKRRETTPTAQRARDDARCAALDAMLDIGAKFAG
jgi:hypothetical protein